MEKSTLDTLLKAYNALQEIVLELYGQGDEALSVNNFNDANLLYSQADKLFEVAENLALIIAEQEEDTP